MSGKITIRDVSEEVRDELAARAAAQGLSMQKFLLAALERIASRPSVETLLERIRERNAVAWTQLMTDEALRDRDADR